MPVRLSHFSGLLDYWLQSQYHGINQGYMSHMISLDSSLLEVPLLSEQEIFSKISYFDKNQAFCNKFLHSSDKHDGIPSWWTKVLKKMSQMTLGKHLDISFLFLHDNFIND